MQTIAQKVEAVESSLRRWHTRLTRASNAIRKLEAKRRRLLLNKQVQFQDCTFSNNSGEGFVLTAAPAPEVRTLADRPRDPTCASQNAQDDLGIPAFLSRKPDEGTAIAARKSEAVDKKKMPLTGKEALAAIRAASDKVTAKHEKRNRAFQRD